MTQYVICPICTKEKATNGGITFRCCRHEFSIEQHKTAYSDKIYRKTNISKSEKTAEKTENSLNSCETNNNEVDINGDNTGAV